MPELVQQNWPNLRKPSWFKIIVKDQIIDKDERVIIK